MHGWRSLNPVLASFASGDDRDRQEEQIKTTEDEDEDQNNGAPHRRAKSLKEMANEEQWDEQHRAKTMK